MNVVFIILGCPPMALFLLGVEQKIMRVREHLSVSHGTPALLISDGMLEHIQSSPIYFKYPETSLVYFKSWGVTTNASVSIPTDCTSTPLFSLLSSAHQSVTWQWNSGAWRGAWNLKYTRLDCNDNNYVIS